MSTYYYYGDTLYHHGVKGQKWGVRNYQNEDGSYKPGAKGRYDPEPVGHRIVRSTVSKVKTKVDTVKSKIDNSKNKVNDAKNKVVQTLKDPKVQKAIKIGAAVAATALVAYGAYKLNNSRLAVNAGSGKSIANKLVNAYSSATKKALDAERKVKMKAIETKKTRLVAKKHMQREIEKMNEQAYKALKDHPDFYGSSDEELRSIVKKWNLK